MDTTRLRGIKLRPDLSLPGENGNSTAATAFHFPPAELMPDRDHHRDTQHCGVRFWCDSRSQFVRQLRRVAQTAHEENRRARIVRDKEVEWAIERDKVAIIVMNPDAGAAPNEVSMIVGDVEIEHGHDLAGGAPALQCNPTFSVRCQQVAGNQVLS